MHPSPPCSHPCSPLRLAADHFFTTVGFSGQASRQPDYDGTILELPLAVSLLLLLISQFALTLVIPHEARQAEHRCGLDEVKMAAFVGIAAAPILVLVLFLTDVESFSNPLVLAALLASTAMSLKVTSHLVYSRSCPAAPPSLHPGMTGKSRKRYYLDRSRTPMLPNWWRCVLAVGS